MASSLLRGSRFYSFYRAAWHYIGPSFDLDFAIYFGTLINMITRETIDKTLALPKMISPARAAITVAQETQSEKQSGRSVELQDPDDDQSMTEVTILDAAIRRKARGRSTVEHLDEETIFRSSSCLL